MRHLVPALFTAQMIFSHQTSGGSKKCAILSFGLLKKRRQITEVQYQAALAEPIATRTPQSRSEENYAMGLVRRELDAILEEEDIRLGGLVVHTTLTLICRTPRWMPSISTWTRWKPARISRSTRLPCRPRGRRGNLKC